MIRIDRLVSENELLKNHHITQNDNDDKQQRNEELQKLLKEKDQEIHSLEIKLCFFEENKKSLENFKKNEKPNFSEEFERTLGKLRKYEKYGDFEEIIEKLSKFEKLGDFEKIEECLEKLRKYEILGDLEKLEEILKKLQKYEKLCDFEKFLEIYEKYEKFNNFEKNDDLLTKCGELFKNLEISNKELTIFMDKYEKMRLDFELEKDLRVQYFESIKELEGILRDLLNEGEMFKINVKKTVSEENKKVLEKYKIFCEEKQNECDR